MSFISNIRQKTKESGIKTILFPEGEDLRMQQAVKFLKDENLMKPVLLGDKVKIDTVSKENNISLDGIEIIDPSQERNPDFIQEYYELRKKKGMTEEQAEETLKNPLFYAAMMIRKGMADAAIAGAVNTTGNVLRAGIQVIGLAEGIKVVSSCFFMVLPDGKVLTFGDCAVIPNPDIEQLASIAVSTAESHLKVVKETPKVAMLSFSTKGSAEHDDVTKVIEATKRVKELKPALDVDGELQFDAAYNEQIGKRKAPESKVAGQANVYIFPDLDAGNIGYKIAQRLGKAEAIGPIIQGLAKPFNDLSRGCSTEDIINTACICSLLA
ncbi:MAG: phosphate acetyltransferase [Calditrichae bacterium]|nr:phosphate acetyltransferase [Calditrichia bacterium]